MYNQMLKRQAFLSSQIDECLRVINAAPPGKLEIHKNNTSSKWFIKPDNFVYPNTEISSELG